MVENDIVIDIKNLKKKYKLGSIGGGTLRGEIQSRFALKMGKEDPNLKIGQKNYQKEFWALKGINLQVARGERIGIIGHNGAGKSTLLKILSRITAPTEGKIIYKGKITSMLEVGTGFHGELTGRENIYLNAAILGMERSEVDKVIDEIIEFSECEEFIDTPVKRYSSGMYVKLAFAVASHLESNIMIMDEVLAVGDVAFQNKCLDRMSRLAEEESRTILYVSHNMNTIRRLCDRCIVLEHGEKVFDGDVDSAINIYKKHEEEVWMLGNRRYDDDNTISLSFEILRESCAFMQDDNIETQLDIITDKNIDYINARFEIKGQDDEKVGIYFTKSFSVNKGHNLFDINLPLKVIPEGQYYITVVIFEILHGRYEDYALIARAAEFRVLEDKRNYCGITWSPEWRTYLGTVDVARSEKVKWER